MKWRERAECARVVAGKPLYHPEDWFPAPTDEAGIAYAKQVCGRCLVRVDCREDILTVEGSSAGSQRFGVVGGMTGNERANHRRQERRRSVVSGPRSLTPRRAVSA